MLIMLLSSFEQFGAGILQRYTRQENEPYNAGGTAVGGLERFDPSTGSGLVYSRESASCLQRNSCGKRGLMRAVRR